jgi:predicted AlkP superfamily pyrophosphatase or phosphodiesterase
MNTMKKPIATILTAIFLLAASLGAQHTTRSVTFPGPIQHVIVVSIDGLMPASYTNPAAHGLKLPMLEEMVRHGAWSDGALSVMPTVTYPAHTSIATGTNPGTHGIFTNVAWDPLEKNMVGWRWYAEDIRAPTLWELARARGLHTALVYWPVTVGVVADLDVPEYWRASIPEDLKLIRALSTPGTLEEVAQNYPDFYAGFTPPTAKDAAVADIACYAIETQRPNLLMVHLAEVDHWEHEKGPFSPEADAAMENADRQVARLVASAKKSGIWPHTALVVVSDHGFAPITQRARPGVLLVEKGLVTLDEKNHIADWKAVVLAASASAYLYVKEERDAQTRQALLDTFQPLAGKPQSGIRRVIQHDEIIKLGGDPQAFLALEAADGFSIASGYTGSTIGPSTQAGTHGYFPDRPEMNASLLFYGPKIAAGKIEHARLIDVAPTVAPWLGLKLTKAEGAALKIALRPAQ